MKPISSHAEKLSKALADTSLSDRRRYDGVLIEINGLIQLSVILIREHGQAVGASPFAWRVAALVGETDLALDQFEPIFEDTVGEDKELDRKELLSLSSSLSRSQLSEEQRQRINVLLERFSAIYGEQV